MYNFHLILPEIFLALAASQLLGFGLSGWLRRRLHLIYPIAIAILAVYVFLGLVFGQPEGEALKGALRIDGLGYYAKTIIGLTAIAALLFARDFFAREELERYEYSVLLLYAVLGMSLMVSSHTLLSLYIGLEMQSLALYVMAAFNRDSLRASEAGLKYFILGVLSSGLLLYGISLIYGFTGTLDFTGIAASVQAGISPGIVTGMVFILCGLGFKISAAPFHMWTPDVYEGAPTPVTGFFASAPKFAAMILLVRVLAAPFGDMLSQWQQVIIIFALLSMFVGAIGALVQTNIKRLMAYSSITNMGYALVALAAGGEAGVHAMLIFMTIYLVTVVGMFAAILHMRTRSGAVENIHDLAGLSRSDKGLALIMTCLIFSLMGIPPFLGFFAKLFAFLPAVYGGLAWLVVCALLASVISAFYYLRLVKLIWVDEHEHEFIQPALSLRGLCLFTMVLIFPLGCLPFIALPVQDFIRQAAHSLF